MHFHSGSSAFQHFPTHLFLQLVHMMGCTYCRHFHRRWSMGDEFCLDVQRVLVSQHGAAVLRWILGGLFGHASDEHHFCGIYHHWTSRICGGHCNEIASHITGGSRNLWFRWRKYHGNVWRYMRIYSCFMFALRTVVQRHHEHVCMTKRQSYSTQDGYCMY